MSIEVSYTVGKVPVLDVLKKNLSNEDDCRTLKSVITDLVKDEEVGIVVNLSNVGYVSEDGLGVLFTCHKDVLQTGGKLALCISSKGSVCEKIKTTKFNQYFNVFTDIMDAINFVRS